LQAELDLHAFEAARLREGQSLEEGRIQLNVLMGGDPVAEFSVGDSLPLAPMDTLRRLYERALSDQTLLIVRARQVELAKTAEAEAATWKKPRLDFGASYQYARTHNQAGFLLFNQNYGLNTGFTLTWNLYNGHNTRRQLENARLAVIAAQTDEERTRTEAAARAAMAMQACSTARAILEIEEKNLQLATRQYALVRERCLAGAGTAFELREAQRLLEDTRSRAIGTRFEALRAEWSLRRMAGSF
jgi:outer membrane protein TolC